MKANNLQEQAADAMLESNVGFTVKGIGHLEIKPLRLCTMIDISNEALKIDVPKGEIKTTEALALSKEHAMTACIFIAKAIVGTGTIRGAKWFQLKSLIEQEKIISNEKKQVKELAVKLVNNLTSEGIDNLTKVVISQSKPDFFFYSMSRISGIRVMEPVIKETIATGEQ